MFNKKGEDPALAKISATNLDLALQAQVNEYFQAALVRHRESCSDEYECRRRAHADADLFRQSLQRQRKEKRKKPQER